MTKPALRARRARASKCHSLYRGPFAAHLSGQVLETRSLLAADITFAANILTINITGAGETVSLFADNSGDFNIISDQGTTADAAAQAIGFSAASAANALNDGVISAVSDVRRIVINGAAGIQTLNIGGGTYTALTVTNGAEDVENISFENGAATFSRLAPASPDANLDATASLSLSIASNAAIFTTDAGNVRLEMLNNLSTSLTVNGLIQPGDNGSVELRNFDGITISGSVAVTGTGTITARADSNGGGAGDMVVAPLAGVFADIGDIDLHGANTQIQDQVLTSGGGDVIISARDNLTVSESVIAMGSGTITLQADDNSGGTGTLFVDANGVVVTTGSNTITLIGADIDLLGVVNSQGEDVNLRPSVSGAAINLGTDSGFGLTDADFDTISAGIIRVGLTGGAGSGAITITEDISIAPPTTLVLQSNAGITQEAGDTITARNLAIRARLTVDLPEANDVNTFAARVTDPSQNLAFTDIDEFNLDTIDGIAGASTTKVTARLTLTAGGAVGQTSGALVGTQFLRLLGTGPYFLTDASNDVISVSADLTAAGTGSLFYTDANDVQVGGVVAPFGITTNGSEVSISTLDGTIIVFNTDGDATADIELGAGRLTLSAGSFGSDHQIDIRADAGIVASGGVNLFADHMLIDATVHAGTQDILISPFEGGTLIDLGSAADTDAIANTLELSVAELNRLEAHDIFVGSSGAGDLSITSAINTANATGIQLTTGSAILDNNAGLDITDARIAFAAGTGIGSAADPIETHTPNLEAQTDTGGIFVDNSGPLNLLLGGVNGTLNGVQVLTSGDIRIRNDSADILLTLSPDEVVSTAAGNILLQTQNSGDILVRNGATASIYSDAGNVTLDSAGDIELGNTTLDAAGNIRAAGDVTLTAVGDITLDENSDIQVTGSGTFTATAGGNFSILASDGTSGAQISTEAGTISISTAAGRTVTIDSDASFALDSSPSFAGGQITIATDHIVINDVDAIRALNAQVQFTPVTLGSSIELGSAADAALDFSDTELDGIVTTKGVRIGDGTTTGDIYLVGQVNLDNPRVNLIALQTTGAVIDVTPGEQTDLSVSSLAIRAGQGIGSTDDLDLELAVLAASNSTNGNVNLNVVGRAGQQLTIGGIDGITQTRNQAAGGSLTITAIGGMFLAHSVRAVGSVSLIAPPSPGPNDEVFLSGGSPITVESSAGDITLRAGDRVVINGNSVVSAFNNLTVTGGFGEVDGGEAINDLGVVVGALVTFSGGGGADTFIVNPSGGTTPIAINGLGGNDIFTITPDANIAFSIDGGSPVFPTFPGDTLDVDLSAAVNPVYTPNGIGAGTFTFDNFAAIDFVSIELLAGDDFGDAPAPFGTLLADDGPRHAISPALFLGSFIDFDLDGQPTADALGDDTDADGDDEDGVTLPGTFIAGLGASINVDVTGTGLLDAWIDFDADGVFEPNEQIAASFAVVDGNNVLNFIVPITGTVDGPTFARFRLSSTGGLGPTGAAADGEVEDYAVDLTVLPPGGAGIFPDPNNPGQDILIVNGKSGNDTILIEPAFFANFAVRLNGKVILTVPYDAFDSIAILGQAGNDTIKVSSGMIKPTQIFGGPGADKLYGGGGIDRIYGEAGADSLYGYNGNDILDGGTEIDKLYGGNGNDTILGGEGADTAYGEAGNDLIRGGNGSDALYGDAGSDIVLGEAGADKLFGGAARDILIGGTGKDTLQGDAGEDIEIGGTTSHDASDAALVAILAEWNSGLAYNVRVNDLRGGAGFNFETGVDVFDDGEADILRGNADKDWFHKGIGDTTPDKVAAELLN